MVKDGHRDIGKKRLSKKVQQDLTTGLRNAAQKGFSQQGMAWRRTEAECKAIIMQKGWDMGTDPGQYGIKPLKHPEKGDGFLAGPNWLLDHPHFESVASGFMKLCKPGYQKQIPGGET